MYSPTSVSLSGPAFSFLLYENTKCRFQQEGFLLGEIVTKETKTITDNDQQQVNISRTIKINSVLPFPQNHYIYDGTGKVDKDKIKVYLGNKFGQVLAWYKYQKLPNAKFTFRDKIIHRQLLEIFHISPELFSCCLLTKEMSENGSTHTFSQIFVRCNSLGCDELPSYLPNLSDPNNMYKNSERASETFNKILGDLKIDKNNTQGVVIINKIQNALQKHIETLVNDLSESERYIYELEEEIRQSLEAKRTSESTQSSNESSTNTQSSSQSVPNNVKEENKNPGFIDTPSSGENSPEPQRKTVNKKTSVRGRGRPRKDSKDFRKNSKTEEEVYGCV